MTKRIPISKIVVDASVQPRDRLNTEVVRQYEDIYRDPEQRRNMPPLRVHEVAGELFLCDGFHRIEGAIAADLDEIPCDVREGSTRGALLIEAIRANSIHGQQLTASEKRKAVARLIVLYSENDVPWTQKDIADIVGLSQSQVSRIRKQDLGDIEEPEGGSQDDDYIERAAAEFMRTESEDGEEVDEASAQRNRIEAMIEPGRVIPDAIFQKCREISSLLHKARSTKGCDNVVENMTTLEMAVQTLVQVREMRIEQVCGNCGGHGCPACHHRGWLTKNEAARRNK